jgi:hypothetical protein
MKLETVVPFFPGFYESELDWMIDNEIEMEMEEPGESWEQVDARTDYRKAMVEISKQWLNRFNAETGYNLEFGNLESPREYNFTTDKVLAYISLEEVEKAREICGKNLNEFDEFLQENFTSYDGFISFYSNDFESEDWNKPTEELDPVECMTFLAVAILCETSKEDLLNSIHGHSSVYEAAQHVWKY